jgi:hypothetical protein
MFVSSFASVSSNIVSSLLPARIMHGSAAPHELQASEEIELGLIVSTMVEERETMGGGPGWIRSSPAEASKVGRVFGVEDNAFLFE